jgi:predicted nucleotidyltransferase
MKTFEEIKHILSAHRSKLESEHKVKRIGVFGSVISGRQKKKSDIDILVEFRRTPDLFEFMELEEYLAVILQSKIDLVTKGALKPYIGKRILEEVVYL